MNLEGVLGDTIRNIRGSTIINRSVVSRPERGTPPEKPPTPPWQTILYLLAAVATIAGVVFAMVR